MKTTGYLFLLLLPLLYCSCPKTQQPIAVFVEQSTPQTDYALENAGRLFGLEDFVAVNQPASADITVRLAKEDELVGINPGGYVLKKRGAHPPRMKIIAKDANGALYGLFEVAEQLSFHEQMGWLAEQKTVSPALANRTIKFNLPWSSYRKGKALDLHLATCRDTAFWRGFLDNMAVNRFNVLTLWNLHPFTDMVRLEKYPEASPYSEAEMVGKRQFWRTLFRMAKARGIQTYLVNWNIFVSEEFAAAHGIATYSKSSGFWGDGESNELIEDYTRECVRQVIDDYPNLTGIGLTLGERMGGMTSAERRDWVNRTIIAGMAQAQREVKLLYRAPLSAGTSSHGTTDKTTEMLTREVLDTLSVPAETLISFKYNWSHGHSSDQLFIVHGGKLTDTYWNPIPENYSMMWTIRNEDFFTLRWGQPDFVRAFLRNNTSQPYVSGCILGSECYLPAKDYFSKDFGGKPFTYAYERQWLWYAIWGRLLYEPDTPDALFANQLNRRFQIDYGDALLDTWKTASDYYHLFASFHMGTWDATLYGEAFAATIRAEGVDLGGTRIITMAALGNRPVLDTVRFVNIADFVQGQGKDFGDRMTPPGLADLLEQNAEGILADLEEFRAKGKPDLALDIEFTDLESLAYLQRFFAQRIRATLALADHLLLDKPLNEARIENHLDTSIAHWKTITALKEQYNLAEIPYMFDDELDYDDYLDVLERERMDYRQIEAFWVHDLR